MKPVFVKLGLLSALVLATVPVSSVNGQTNPILQQHSFGTIARNSTICVGPLSPSDANGVQIFGFTNGNRSLTWQVFSTSSQTAPVLVFETTARFVDHTVPPEGNLLYYACVVKSANSAQDYDLSLNSQTLE